MQTMEMQIGHVGAAASCAHLIGLDWQIVDIVQSDDIPRKDANHRRYVVAVVGKSVVSNGGVVRGHERKWAPYFWRIGHNLLLCPERHHNPKCTHDENNDFHRHLNLTPSLQRVATSSGTPANSSY